MFRWLVRVLAPLILSLVLLPLVSACTVQQIPCTSTLSDANRPLARTLTDWYGYTSIKGKYRACFPGKPREEQNVLSAEDFGQALLVMVIYENNNQEKVYAISHSHFPLPKDISISLAQRLDEAQAGMARGAGADAVSQAPIVQSGYEGRQIVLSRNNEPFAKARIFYIDDLLYQIFVTSNNLETSDVTTFLDLVQLQPQDLPVSSEPELPPKGTREVVATAPTS